MERYVHNAQKQPWGRCWVTEGLKETGGRGGMRAGLKKPAQGLMDRLGSSCWVTTGAMGDTDSPASPKASTCDLKQKHLPFCSLTSVHLHGCFLNHSSSDLGRVILSVCVTLLSFSLLSIWRIMNLDLRKSIHNIGVGEEKSVPTHQVETLHLCGCSFLTPGQTQVDFPY